MFSQEAPAHGEHSEKNLEDILKNEFSRFDIDEKHRDSLRRYLELIRQKDVKTYEHSLRVSFLGVKVAEFLKMESKPLLFSGLLHDLGKIIVEPELLKKQGKFSREDMEKMKSHPVYGYWLLRNIHDFSAEVILRHHRFQEESYPAVLPEPKVPFDGETNKLVERYARLLALVDFYDAAATRKDKKNRQLNPTEIRHIVTKSHPDQKDLIDELYEAGIFGRPIQKVMGATSPTTVSELVAKQESLLDLSERIDNNVRLACALEPISDKPGCTTRFIDIKENKALEYFIAAGINIGPAFRHLTEHLIRTNKPDGIYNYLKEAVILSKSKRGGGKINQGMLEFLLPIVAAQILYDRRAKGDIGTLLEKASELLQNTSKEDVENLIEAKRIANAISGVEKKYPVREYDVDNVSDYYLKEYETEKEQKPPKTTSIFHNKQFVENFPDIKFIYDQFMASSKPRFSDKTAEAYKKLLELPGHEKMGVGLAADFVAAASYLILTYSKQKEII